MHGSEISAHGADRLKSFGLWPRVVGELIVDRALADVACAPEEEAAAWQNFCARRQLDPGADGEAVRRRFGLDREELRALCRRQLRVEKFKLLTFGHALPAHFLKRKTALDRIVYSILRLRDPDLARELYLQIEEGEQTFGALAARYSEGPEALTRGLVGPVALGAAAPQLREILAASEPGRLRPPVRIGEWWVVTRVERMLLAEFDDAVHEQLLQELFELWLEGEIQRHFAGTDER